MERPSDASTGKASGTPSPPVGQGQSARQTPSVTGANNSADVAAGANAAWRLVVRETGEVVVPRLIVADRFWPRLVGLQFRDCLAHGSGLLLVPCNSVHTCFLRFPIDLACLDCQGRVVKIRKHLRPWRAAIAPAGTHAILETAADEMTIAVGQTLAAESPIAADIEVPRSLRFLR